MSEQEPRGLSGFLCWFFEMSEGAKKIVSHKSLRLYMRMFLLSALLLALITAAFGSTVTLYLFACALFACIALFLLTTTKTTSLREFFYFLLSRLFCLSLLVFGVVSALLSCAQEYFNIVFSPYIVLSLFFLLHMILWIFVSLMADAAISKLANGLFSALVGIFTAVLNVVLIALPHEITFQGRIVNLSPIHLWTNLILLPFVFASILALPIIELKEYWDKKYNQ